MGIENSTDRDIYCTGKRHIRMPLPYVNERLNGLLLRQNIGENVNIFLAAVDVCVCACVLTRGRTCIQDCMCAYDDYACV